MSNLESMFHTMSPIDTENQIVFRETRHAMLRKCRPNAFLIRSQHARHSPYAKQFIAINVKDPFV